MVYVSSNTPALWLGLIVHSDVFLESFFWLDSHSKVIASVSS